MDVDSVSSAHSSAVITSHMVPLNGAPQCHLVVVLSYDDGRLVDGRFVVDRMSYVQTRRVLLSNCDWPVDGNEMTL